MTSRTRNTRIRPYDEDVLHLLDWTPSVTEDPDVMDLLAAYEAELILRGHL